MEQARGLACAGLFRAIGLSGGVHFSICDKYPIWYFKLPGTLKSWEKDTKTNLYSNQQMWHKGTFY